MRLASAWPPFTHDTAPSSLQVRSSGFSLMQPFQIHLDQAGKMRPFPLAHRPP